MNHLTKKTALYDPAKVIEACEKAFNADGMDAQFAYIAGALETDQNPWASWGDLQVQLTPVI